MTDENDNQPKVPQPLEGVDYYFEDGLMVLTEAYHLKRGSCCKNGCRHCPYGFKKETALDSKKPKSM